jgi:hypothetical protein
LSRTKVEWPFQFIFLEYAQTFKGSKTCNMHVFIIQNKKKFKQIHLGLAQQTNWTHNLLKNTRKLNKYKKYLKKCFFNNATITIKNAFFALLLYYIIIQYKPKKFTFSKLIF